MSNDSDYAILNGQIHYKGEAIAACEFVRQLQGVEFTRRDRWRY